MSDEKILETFASPGDGFVYAGNEGYVDHEEYSHWPCSILKSGKEKGRYTIRIHMSPLKGAEPSETSWNKNEVPRILTNYPQESIHYFVKPSATDQMLPNSFRYPIGFPHKLFPKQWKNKRISNDPWIVRLRLGLHWYTLVAPLVLIEARISFLSLWFGQIFVAETLRNKKYLIFNFIRYHFSI